MKTLSKIIAILLVLSLSSQVYGASKFTDLKGYEWAKSAIETLENQGIIKGTSTTTFSPDKNITRADFAVILVRWLDLKSDSIELFEDVYIGAYYAKAVGIAKSLGIINGTGKGRFSPGSYITKQDMILMVYRALKYKGYDLSDKKTLSRFKDEKYISDYARVSIEALESKGIIDWIQNELKPKEYATRAEAAMLIYQAIEKLNMTVA